MLYGITGSSGTGKSTLAKAVAESLGIEFMPTSITACAKKHGFDAVAPMTLQERLHLQWHLFNDHMEMLKSAPRPLIVDRTPIDMIGYLLGEIDMHSHLRMSPQDIADTEAYKTCCLEATVQYYDHVFITGQLPAYETAETRPADNRAYQSHSQLIMEGAAFSLTGRLSFTVLRSTDAEEREIHVHDAIVSRLDRIDRMKRTALYLN